jgi:flagellar motor switch protein FliN/FliY
MIELSTPPDLMTVPDAAVRTAPVQAIVQPVSLPELGRMNGIAGAPLSINLALFDSVNVTAQVVLGHVDVNLGSLLRMREGDTVKTDRTVQQSVDVVVNGNVVARGELVAVDDNFGVRILEIAANGAA